MLVACLFAAASCSARAAEKPNILIILAEDISEQNNVAADHPDVVRSMMKKMHAWEALFEKTPLFISDIHWMRPHTPLYDREYQLTQPE